MIREIDIAKAFIRGEIISLLSRGPAIGQKLRVYQNCTVIFHKGCRVTIGKNVKINKNSTLSVRPNGTLNLGDEVSLGENAYVVVHDRIEIGEGTITGQNVMIYDHDHVFNKNLGVNGKAFKTAPVTIGKNCWIGAGTIILRGTTIGNNCVVGAGCVLKGTYPAGSVIIQKRETEIR